MDDDMISLETSKPAPAGHEEEEEALSLCDFPLTITSDASADDQDHHNPPSQPSDNFFEFFNDDLNSENIIYSHAEDIISCGKLVPCKLRHKPPFDEQILKSVESGYDDVNIRDYSSRRYCESLPERPMIRSNSGSNNTRLTRTSRSLDSRNLRRTSSLVKKYPDASPEMHRSFSLKPRRYAFMFGLLKFPSPEMDLQDMKNRQVRRSHVLATVEGGGANKRRDRRNSWGDDLLRVLSCKKDASVAVTPSINGLVP